MIARKDIRSSRNLGTKKISRKSGKPVKSGYYGFPERSRILGNMEEVSSKKSENTENIVKSMVPAMLKHLSITSEHMIIFVCAILCELVRMIKDTR